ncbi:cation acetate symporter [Streptomyces tubbatahanensis]|uniref:Cation acetate symporter n=1 Tax=Streptomyces tubbatahanensis TaxID=2923272 RepID=A0ABY3Y347_9ACTN|nr:cation acetate symporter [Streptomyces tubbatahanensis]UNT01263.1 cation acetate symporter [Streptomyces tubbatahanensis]
MATLAITCWAGTGRRVGGGRRGSSEEFFAGGRLFSPLENGFAIAGDHMSAASFLGVSGLVALYGYDGMLYAVGFLAAWLVVLFFVAEPVRNCGRFTLADVLVARLRERPVRIALGASSVTVSVLYLVAQLVGAGSVVALLLGDPGGAAYTWTVLGVGGLMVCYVACGGMRATTWIQIVKAVLLLGGAFTLSVLVLLRFGGDLADLLTSAAEHSGRGADFLSPGLQYGRGGWAAKFDFVSLGLALLLGTAGLPHILARFSTVPTARAARRSVVWSTVLIGGFYLMALVLGIGAAALVGTDAVRRSSPAGNTAVPLLSFELGGGAGTTGGAVLFALVAAVTFATVLAVVAGVTLAASAAVAHDLYESSAGRRRQGKAGRLQALKRGTDRRARGQKPEGGQGGQGGQSSQGGQDDRSEVAVARRAALVVGALAVGLSLPARELNVAFLVGLAFAVAASAHLPVLLYALFRRRFTTRGAVRAVYGGLLSSMVLVALSPVVSGAPRALFPGVDFACFPLENPGIVSIPFGFLCGWLGTLRSRERPDEGRYAETEVRSLTGAGAV